MFKILQLLCAVGVLALFFNSKLAPYKDRLTGQYKSSYETIQKILDPFLGFFRAFAQPIQVGYGVSVDSAQFVLLALFLILLLF